MNESNITVEVLKERLDKGENLLIVDVREPWEYEEFNINGKHIPLGELPGRIEELTDQKDAEIVIHCKSGMRSAAAREYLIKHGFSNVRNLTGGMLAWQEKFK